MVPTLEEFKVEAVSFGGELKISWLIPQDAPTNHKVYVFKRSKTDVTQDEIDEYFENIEDLSEFDYNGLMVYDRLQTSEGIRDYYFKDLTVINGIKYYYKAVIRDEDSGEVGIPLSANATPVPDLRIDVKDGKELAAKIIEKTLDNVYDRQGNKVGLGKDIKVVKNWAYDVPFDNFFAIERINGSNEQRYWGQIFAKMRGGSVYGGDDTDVIRATFITIDTPQRRDVVCNIMRAQKEFMIMYAKKALKLRNIDVVIEGDSYRPEIHGVNAVAFSMIFMMTLKNRMLVPEEILIHIFGDLRVDYKTANENASPHV